MEQNFSDFKENFYSKVKDLFLFNCAEFNLLKVVLDGLKVNYSSRIKIRTPLFYSSSVLSFFLFLKRMLNKSDDKTLETNAKILIFDSARAVLSKEGVYVHFRYENIIKYYGTENCTVVLNKPEKKLKYNYDFLSLLKNYSVEKLSREDKKLRNDLIEAFNKIQTSQIFDSTELMNIKIAFQLFFNQYRVFNTLIKKGKYKVCHFDGHYHREGLMLALKRNNVLAHELQHGLIAPEDIFYVFPKQIKSIVNKALFPDKMYVFSNYWKNILLKGVEFDEKQIEIIGDYQYKTTLTEKEKVELLHFKGDCELIIVATQTTLHSYFVDYTKFLHEHIVKNKLKFKILFKIHPSEKEELYTEIFSLPTILKVTVPITNVFEYCKIQISIYSTTLYESLPYGVRNYSLNVPICSDYIKHFTDNNISQLLNLNELPFEKSDQKNTLSPDFYYAPFTPEVLKEKA